jgi:outer membrane receptor for ferrienterochelin and colicin
MKRRLLLTLLVTIVFSSAIFAQGLIRGVLQDVNTNETLIGASVVIKGTTIGVTTNLDGSFLLIAPEGEHTLIFRFVGYEEQTMDVTVKDGATYNVGTILMQSSSIGLEEVSVIASVAIDRQTPVAVSTISSQTIQENLGSQEFPEVMNYTPNVYATKGSGGYGDSRINIRGFDQRNVAVMINGIPVNDMENGWVYWSNWAGLGDATRTIQIQRGLSASKLAINSVGGMINIITKTTDINRGGSVEISATDFGRFKTMVSLSTGRLKTGTAITFVGSRTFGEGYIDATWVDAWSYFLSISQDIGKKHQLVFTAIGAPQQHGQRDGFYALDSATYERYGPKYTQNWGELNGEVLNERVNYYHKPQISANWYYDINDKAFLATSAYISFGNGGGSGPLGVRNTVYDQDGNGYFVRFEPPMNNTGQYNWDLMSDINAQEMYSVSGEDTTFYPAGESKHIIRNSVNNHFWTGILSNLNYKFNQNWILTAGIDGRFYVGEHYREVRNLIGGDYWTDNRFGQVQVGDKVAYWNDGRVSYGGLFGQIEWTNQKFAAFLGGTISNTWTQNVDYYNYHDGIVSEEYAQDNPAKSEVLTNFGWNAKAGFNWNINEQNNVFINGGAYSRVPFFRFHFLNFRNDVNPDLTNELIYATEIGYGFKSKKVRLNFNGYYTVWDKISQLATFRTPDPDNPDQTIDLDAFVSDLQAVHMGIELDVKYTINRWVNIGGLLAIGDWRYANDPIANLYDEQTREKIGEGTLYLKDLKVPDQPQTQIGLNADFRIAKRIDLGAQWLYYDNLYAQYTLEDRTDPSDRAQSWKLPAYGVVNGRFIWSFEFAGLASQLQVNVYNLFDTVALMEAEDQKADDGDYYTFYKGFWVWGRNFNFALRVNF